MASRKYISVMAAFCLLDAAACEPNQSKTVLKEARCALAHPVEEFASLDDMPSAVAGDLLERLAGRGADGSPPIAAREDEFNFTDAVDGDLSMRRFARGGRSGDKWFVWYQHGGLGSHVHIVIYEADATAGFEPRLTLNMTMVPDQLCEATDVLLAGQLPQNAHLTVDEW